MNKTCNIHNNFIQGCLACESANNESCRSCDQLRAEVEESHTLLRTLLHLHNAQVWVKEPWNKTFELVKERLGG